jgi:hypothetical protein
MVPLYPKPMCFLKYCSYTPTFKKETTYLPQALAAGKKIAQNDWLMQKKV